MLFAKQGEAHFADISVHRVTMNFVQPTQYSNTTTVIKRHHALNWTKSGYRMHLSLKMLRVTVKSRIQNRGTLLKDREDHGVVTTKQHMCLHKFERKYNVKSV